MNTKLHFEFMSQEAWTKLKKAMRTSKWLTLETSKENSSKTTLETKMRSTFKSVRKKLIKVYIKIRILQSERCMCFFFHFNFKKTSIKLRFLQNFFQLFIKKNSSIKKYEILSEKKEPWPMNFPKKKTYKNIKFFSKKSVFVHKLSRLFM